MTFLFFFIFFLTIQPRSIPDPTPSTMTALHQFGAEMLKLSRGLESFTPMNEPSNIDTVDPPKAKGDVSSINNSFESSSTEFPVNITKQYVYA